MQAEVTSFGGGRYQIHRLVGSGGMGSVFLALDTTLNRWVAIKRLKAETEAGLERAEAVFREARTLAALQHPHVVTIHDCIRDDNDTLVIMEYVAGRTLEDITAEAPLTLEDFLTVARQSLEGLAAAHARGLLHRDIKPSNLMVTRQASGLLEVKILDFGLAKPARVLLEQSTDLSGSLLGSIHTMAPEQFERQPLDARTDLYALGCVFYQCLTGRPPFDGATVAEIMHAHLQGSFAPLESQRPDVPPALLSWVERLMARHPDHRPASARQAAGLLKAIAEGSTRRVALPPETPAATGESRLQRLGLAGAGTALVVLAGAAAWWFLRPAPPQPSSETPPASAPAPSTAENPPAPPDVLPASSTSELLAKNGTRVRVEGTVSRIGESRSGDVLYVNFLGNTRGDLALVQFTTDGRKASDLARLNALVGKRIEVEGAVSIYRDAPQIVITADTPIRLLETP